MLCVATSLAASGSIRRPIFTPHRTSQFFQLRQHLHRNKELQAEWNAHGESSFEFTVLETLSEETPSLNLRDILQERKQAWTVQSKV
jgi:hypothetical protein